MNSTSPVSSVFDGIVVYHDTIHGTFRLQPPAVGPYTECRHSDPESAVLIEGEGFHCYIFDSETRCNGFWEALQIAASLRDDFSACWSTLPGGLFAVVWYTESEAVCTWHDGRGTGSPTAVAQPETVSNG